MINLKPPKIGDNLVPVFTEDELAALLATCNDGDIAVQGRRRPACLAGPRVLV
jgi:hypothetical protein